MELLIELRMNKEKHGQEERMDILWMDGELGSPGEDPQLHPSPVPLILIITLHTYLSGNAYVFLCLDVCFLLAVQSSSTAVVSISLLH